MFFYLYTSKDRHYNTGSMDWSLAVPIALVAGALLTLSDRSNVILSEDSLTELLPSNRV